MLDNVSSLLATTALTALLGFVFWAVATRMFSQQAIGYGAASVSAFTLIGTIGEFGLGTLLIGELPRRSATRAGLISAALLASALGSLLLGLGFVVVAPHVSSHFAVLMGTPGRAALFVAGGVVTGVTIVFDQGTIGLLRGRLQLARNVVFAVAKLLILPAAAIFLHDAFGFGVTAAWVAGMALSLVAIAVWLKFKGTCVLPRPHLGILRELGWTAMAHNWLNVSIAVPFTVLPVLVTVLVSPAANGAYYAASMLAGFLSIVPAHLSTVLFAVVAGDPRVTARKLRFALWLSFVIGVPGMIVLGFGAHFLLSLFGPGYASEATVPLVLLALSYPFGVPRALYIAVCRSQGRITRAAVVLTTFSAVELGVAAAGAVSGGLIGMSLWLFACRFVEALLVTPPVLRAAMGHGRHRRPANGAPTVVSDAPGTLAGRDGSRPRGQVRPQDGRVQGHAPYGRGPMSTPSRGPAPAGRNGSPLPGQVRPQDGRVQGHAPYGRGPMSTPSIGPAPQLGRAPLNWPPTGPQLGRRESA